MKPLKELSVWDLPNTKYVPDGWDMTEVPTATDDNFKVLLEQHNELVAAFNELLEKVGAVDEF